ncbi:hypothetical protein MAPG_04751 [Magnaporthiopsis poae ATCC 64411]|uniref:Cupin type-2 domain-containing protein n=1 Tax=Magnaporthiopsis poae (strain ATCC 64411 / 73-15) TaxID=644358 RepID=A0A0C4DXJ7_MAGP6|nr:hypothetical protein MAPG_04751 [Magnaporthiopsis poae ATCC 64411]
MYNCIPRWCLRPLNNLFGKQAKISSQTGLSRYGFSSTAKMASSSTATPSSPFATPSTEPPAHEMKYYPKMTTSLPSKSAQFRRVLHTGLYSQVVLMNIPVGGDIGEEVHTVDQILTFTAGMGLAQVGGREQTVQAGDMVIVPAGTRHQFLNKGSVPSGPIHRLQPGRARRHDGARDQGGGRRRRGGGQGRAARLEPED